MANEEEDPEDEEPPVPVVGFEEGLELVEEPRPDPVAWVVVLEDGL